MTKIERIKIEDFHKFHPWTTTMVQLNNQPQQFLNTGGEYKDDIWVIFNKINEIINKLNELEDKIGSTN